MGVTDNSKTALDKAMDTVKGAAETVQATTESISKAIENSRRPGGALNHVSRVVRDAPLSALALALAVGWIVARRR